MRNNNGKKVLLSVLLTAFLFSCFTGCGPAVKVEIPPFQELRSDMGEQEWLVILGDPDEFEYTDKSKKGNVLGYSYYVYSYETLINEKPQYINYYVHAETGKIMFASLSFGLNYMSVSGTFTEEAEKSLNRIREYLVEYYTDLYGPAEKKTDQNETSYTWYLEDGSRISVENNLDSEVSYLYLWWHAK